MAAHHDTKLIDIANAGLVAARETLKPLLTKFGIVAYQQPLTDAILRHTARAAHHVAEYVQQAMTDDPNVDLTILQGPASKHSEHIIKARSQIVGISPKHAGALSNDIIERQIIGAMIGEAHSAMIKAAEAFAKQ